MPAASSATVADIDVWYITCYLEVDVMEAQDNLLKAKIAQSVQANKHCTMNFPFKIGLCVHLSTLNHCNKYKEKGELQLARFMPWYDGPYTIVNTDEEHLTVTLNLPNSPNIHPVFHTSEVLPFVKSDDLLFPSHKMPEPGPLITEGGY